MTHIVPILCLIFFVFFLEIQTRKETKRVNKELQDLKDLISKNKIQINKNKEDIEHGKYM